MTNVLDRLSPGFQAVSAQFSAAGLDLAAILAAGPNGLKEKIAALSAPADLAPAIEAATKQLEVKLAGVEGQVAHLTSHLGAINTAFAKCGVAVKESDPASHATAADIEAAIAARSSIKASEQLAKHHLNEALPLTPSADSTKPAAKKESTLTGLARTEAAIRAEQAARAL